MAIPDDVPFQPRMETPYAALAATLATFREARACDRPARVGLPDALVGRQMHLDPDFGRLTYGDNGERRGKGIAAFAPGDLLVFFAGLRPCRPCQHRLIYAIIGVYRVGEVVRVADVPRARWVENAHTRRLKQRSTDVIVRAQPGVSGRLRTCIPIGEWRSRAYRVREDLLEGERPVDRTRTRGHGRPAAT